MMAFFRSWFALLRSIMVYHGDRERHRRMDGLYAQFVKPGNLVFDIGAHVGDRITSFRESARGSSHWSRSPAQRRSWSFCLAEIGPSRCCARPRRERKVSCPFTSIHRKPHRVNHFR